MVLKREAWAADAPGLDAASLVFVDESGFNVDMARAYARARGGARAVDHAPENTPAATSVVASVRLGAEVAWDSWGGGTTKGRFVGYVRDVLAPTLRPGDVVVLDNLSAHHAKEVAEVVGAAGASVLFLPPYSPDLNPIEKMWSKVKALVRGLRARDVGPLTRAVAFALSKVTPSDCVGWFRSCGYDC